MSVNNLLKGVFILVIITTAYSVKGQNPSLNQDQQLNTEVTDSELQTFLGIMKQAQTVQRKVRSNMMNAIKESGMEMKRFQEISRAKRQGNEVEMTDNEKDAYASIQEVIKTEQQKMRKEMDSIIQNASMDKNRYMEINSALRQDKELQGRLKKIMGRQQQQQ
jgi:hypothetical protein